MKSTQAVALLAALAATSAFAQDPNTGLKALIGKPAPAFKMKDLNGKVLTNQSLKGKVVVLDFWATWCGPCKKASPTMQKLHEAFGKKGVVVIGAETMENGAPSGAKKYAAEHHYTYTFTTDNDAITTQLGIAAIPAFVIIGKDGKVARTETGVPSDINKLFPSFEKTIKGLLK